MTTLQPQTSTRTGAPAGTLTIDGEQLTFHDGETVYEVAQRASAQKSREIPTLCYDPRLEPFGGCRMCIVELEGARNPVASCTTKAAPGMVVHTHTEPVERHRKTILELVASENPDVAEVDELRGYASQELKTLLDRYDVASKDSRFGGEKSGTSFDDDNPFLLRDYDHCISCYRCVRVCEEQEGDYAISIKNRGFDTQIVAGIDGLLKDSSCTFCGQCVQTCPTGALGDKKAMRHADKPAPVAKTRTICPYCGVGCSVDLLSKGDELVGVQPAMDGPANGGALCVKGQFAYDFVQHRDRLKTPLVRNHATGELEEADWDTALDRAAQGFVTALKDHGRHSIFAISSGRAPNESSYVTQKFIRAGFGTNYIDNCSRA